MKKIVTLLLVVAMLLSSMLSLTSCGAPEDAGAEISVYLGDAVYDFDPTDYYVDSNADQVMSLLYEPLFKLDEDGDLKYAGAKNYDVDEADRTITIDLRETYWSDEVRVKAEDYLYAWREVLLDPNSPNPAAALLYDIENAIAVKSGDISYSKLGVVNSDIYELTIKYREGADYKQLLKNLASISTSPLRQDVVSKASTYWSKDMSTIVTNGPFKIAALDYAVGEFTLARNLGYHQKSSAKNYTDNVTPASLISFFTTDGNLELTYADIEDKTVFYMGNATLEDRAENKDKAKVYDDLSTYTYLFNTENPLFAKAEVRYALSLALDRAAIAEAITFGKAATGFLPDAVAAGVYGEDIPERISSDYEANLIEAKALIADAAIPASAKKFTLKINNDEESIAIAELAKEAWAELGFTVRIEKVSTVTSPVVDPSMNEKKNILDSAIQVLAMEATYGKRDFDVIALDWQMYSRDAIVPLSAFTSTMNGNGYDTLENASRTSIGAWSNSEYDQYINAAYKATDAAERADALKEAEKILIESAAIVPVVYNQSFAFVSEDLSSISVDGFGNIVLTKVEQENYQDYLPKEEE